MDENKDQLKSYRWYNNEAYIDQEEKPEHHFIYEEIILSKNQNDFVFLMEFYEVLYETLLFQIDLVVQVLEVQKNPIDLLFEYNTKVCFI